jgi:adenylate cyclase
VANPSSQYAILFADLSGSTSLYEKLGDQRALAAVESVLAEMRKSVAQHQGRVVKTIGDEVMALFPSADDAMQAACDMQNRVAAIAPIENAQLAIRAGFHFGPAIEEGGDIFGDAVKIAARMTTLARSGQIITSGATRAALSPLLQKSTRDLDAMTVRGKQDEMRIFEVLWQDGDDLTTMAVPDASTSTHDPVLTLRYSERTLSINSSLPEASLGRETTNDLIVTNKMASRVHCKIEYRRGQFFLIDQSTNGTYVTIESNAELILKREQVMLRGHGVIGLGHSSVIAEIETVKFTCV